jgi:hypothetical protein
MEILMHKRVIRIAYFGSALALAGATAVPAQAMLLDFELTGSRDASFELQSNPMPNSSSSFAFGSQVQFLDVAGSYGGVAGDATISFGTGVVADLDILSTSLGFTQFAGPDIFSGPADAPVFAPGTFELTSLVSGDSTLTISAVQDAAANSAVSEPASWVVLLTGLGLAGVGLRRRLSDPEAAGA